MLTPRERVSMSVSIHISNATKKYDQLVIIPNLSADINNGEFFTLLGPSGCGKTTLLRMIAGFNSIEAGTISFGDKVINDIPAHKRNIGMVFQNYAIFPHLTVRQNVEYGLKIRKLPSADIKRMTDNILDMVKITEYQNRLPEKLSGGQQQRIALARAIVIHPQVLLMDEPLSNLDAKLRIEMRGAIRDVQNRVGITTIYVTHDQEEALAISDRIAVMNHGVIQQLGTPQQIYIRPYNAFVATFIGHSNLFHATVVKEVGICGVKFPDGFVCEMDTLSDKAENEQKVVVAVRPEEFSIGDRGLRATIVSRTFFGRYITYVLQFGDGICVDGQPSIEYSQDLGHVHTMHKVGDVITLSPNDAKINVFTSDLEHSLIKDVKPI